MRDITDAKLDMFFEQPKKGKFKSYIDYIGRGGDIFKKIGVNVCFDPSKPEFILPIFG